MRNLYWTTSADARTWLANTTYWKDLWPAAQRDFVATRLWRAYKAGAIHDEDSACEMLVVLALRRWDNA